MDFVPPKNKIIRRAFTEQELQKEKEKLELLNQESTTYYIRNHNGGYNKIIINRDGLQNRVSSSEEEILSHDPMEQSSSARKRPSSSDLISDIVQYVQPKIKKSRFALDQIGYGSSSGPQTSSASAKKGSRDTKALERMPQKVLISSKNFDIVLQKGQFNTNRIFDVNALRYILSINFNGPKKKVILM